MWLNVCIEEKLLDLGLVWKNTSQGILPAPKPLPRKGAGVDYFQKQNCTESQMSLDLWYKSVGEGKPVFPSSIQPCVLALAPCDWGAEFRSQKNAMLLPCEGV